MHSLKDDSRLPVVCEELVRNLPVKSVFICGSRATGQGASDSSDYDIGVVMNTFLIPFYWRKLKGLESRLSRKLDSNLIINPLPTFRLHRAAGNLFLFKLKREGTTLYGDDYIPILEPGNIENIGTHWYYSYLFSAMKELINDFTPELLTTEPDEERSRLLLRGAVKAILQCGEIHLLKNGHYEIKLQDMVTRLRKFDLEGLDKPQFLIDLNNALRIRTGESNGIQNTMVFWFRTRECLLSTFRVLTLSNMSHTGSDSHNLRELAAKYREVRNGAKLKNLQYFILALLTKKQAFWRSIVTNFSVEKRVWLALLWLILSIEQEGNIDGECLVQCYDALKAYTITEYSKDAIVFWKNLSKSIMEYYPLASTVMGM